MTTTTTGRTCPVCGGPVQGMPFKKYCNPKCNQRNWRDKNRKALLAKRKLRRDETRDETRELRRAASYRYYHSHLEERRASARRSYQRDPKKHHVSAAEWKNQNPERARVHRDKAKWKYKTKLLAFNLLRLNTILQEKLDAGTSTDDPRT